MGYRGKLEEQERARALRAQGWTLGEICEELGVSKASASLWCRDVAIDAAALALRRRERHARANQGARQRGPNALQRRKQTEIDAARAWALEQIAELTDRDLLVVGAALYAGEGTKAGTSVGFANTNPAMIALFLRWLRRFFEVEEPRLRVCLYLHEGLDLSAAVAFWSEVTGIPPDQFRRPYRAVPDPSIRRSKHPMGCATVIYSSTKVLRRILGLVDALLSSEAPSGVAQLAERLTVNQNVASSSLAPGAPDGVA